MGTLLTQDSDIHFGSPAHSSANVWAITGKLLLFGILLKLLRNPGKQLS